MMKGVVLTIVGLAAVMASASRPDRNAFINYSVHSVAELNKEVQVDSAVADRYMRHFGMTKQQVLDYIGSLHKARLEREQVFQVYSIPPDGHVKMHLQKLHKGEWVFSDATGTPILLMKCGNPLNLGPAENTLIPVPTPYSPGLTMNPMPPGPGQELPPELAMAPPLVPDEIPYIPPTVPPMETPTATFSGQGPAVGGGLILIGGLFVGITHHEHTKCPPPVPEPASMTLFALGVGGLVARRRKLKATA